MKIGIIGPTNIKKLSKITKKPIKFFLERTRKIGEILAKSNVEVWMNSDKGIAFEISKAYKEFGGKNLVFLTPKIGKPWPKKHTLPYLKFADKLRKENDWFWTNYNVVSLPEVCICAGLSAGTLSELAYVKWNLQLKRGRLKKLIVIKELLKNKKLPPEIEMDIKKILVYVNRVEEIKKFLK